MEVDPLQQLRDVHLPIDPSWWPPAIGWWLLAGLAIGLLVWGLRLAWSAYTSRAPIRAARRAYANLYQQFSATQCSIENYIAGANQLLKRLLVHALKRPKYAALSGTAWLQVLDIESQSNDFTQGSGQALGDIRFQRQPQVDAQALHDSLLNLLSCVQPRIKTPTTLAPL